QHHNRSTHHAPPPRLRAALSKANAPSSDPFAAPPVPRTPRSLPTRRSSDLTPLAEDSIAVTANATYETPKGATLSSVGTYYWVASYSGDHNNSAAEPGCAAEPVDVTPAGPAIETTQAPASGLGGGGFKDKAT